MMKYFYIAFCIALSSFTHSAFASQVDTTAHLALITDTTFRIYSANNGGTTYLRIIAGKIAKSYDLGSTWIDIADTKYFYSDTTTALAARANYVWYSGGNTIVRSRLSNLHGLVLRSFFNAPIDHIWPLSSDTGWYISNVDYGLAVDTISPIAPGGFLEPGHAKSERAWFIPIDANFLLVHKIMEGALTSYVSINQGQDWDSLLYKQPFGISQMTGLPGGKLYAFNRGDSLAISSDFGKTFTRLQLPFESYDSFYVFDSVRWFTNKWQSDGMYTTDAGVHWDRVPGWRRDLNLKPVDSMTAFGYSYNATTKSYELWALKLPWWHPPVKDTVTQSLLSQQGSVKNGMTVSPNPATTQIEIRLESELSAPVKVTLHDVLGKFRLKGEGAVLDISTLSEGVYYLRISSGGLAKTRRVVVIR